MQNVWMCWVYETRVTDSPSLNRYLVDLNVISQYNNILRKWTLIFSIAKAVFQRQLVSGLEFWNPTIVNSKANFFASKLRCHFFFSNRVLDYLDFI